MLVRQPSVEQPKSSRLRLVAPPVGVTSMAAHNMKSLFNDMLEHERTETMATLPPLKISVKV